MTKQEYIDLRKKRNKIRDKFNSTGGFLEANRLRKQIKEIDVILSEYENK